MDPINQPNAASSLPSLLADLAGPALDASGVLLYMWRPSGEVFHTNASLREMLGDAACRTWRLSQLLEALYPDRAWRDPALEAHERMMAGSVAEEADLSCAEGSGERHPYHWQFRRVDRPGEGPILAALGWDRTDTCQLQHQVRILSLLLAHVDEAVVVVDPNGRIIHWGGNAETLLGLPAPLRLDRPFSSLFPTARSTQRAHVLIDAIRGGAHVDEEQDLLHADGRSIPCRLVGWPVVDKRGVVDAMAFFLALRSAEAEADVVKPGSPPAASLPLDEEAWDALDRTGQGAIVLTDADGRVRHWNRAAERLAGMGAPRARGRKVLEEVLLLHGLTWKALVAQLETRGRMQQEVQVVRPNGTTARAELEASPLRATIGIAGGVILVLADRSEEYVLRDELLFAKQVVLRATLAESLARRVETILAAMDPEHKALVQGIHDLRQLGRMVESGADSSEIAGFAQGAGLARLERELDPLLFQLGDGSWRLRRIVEDARRFLDEGVEAPRSLDLPSEVDRALALVEHRLAGTCSVEIRMDNGLPEIRAVPSALLRSLCLALLAAADSCRRRAASGPSLVTLSAAERRGWVQVEIADNGEGFGVDVRSRLGDLSWLAGRPGLGPLLLGMCREECRMSGGSFELEGAPGAGARLRIHFPSARASAALLSPQVDGLHSPQRPGPVLVVEDDEMLRRSLERQLSFRFKVVSHRILADALPAVAEGRFAAAVVGFAMPEGLGVRLVERLAETNPLLFANTLILAPVGLKSATLERLARLGSIVLPRATEPDNLAPLLARLMADLRQRNN